MTPAGSRLWYGLSSGWRSGRFWASSRVCSSPVDGSGDRPLSRRVRQLTPELLSDLPASCRSCLFWEVADARPGPDARDPVHASTSKQAWWQAVGLEQRTYSRGLYVDDALVAYALVGEPATFPRARRLGPPASDDALLLGTMWTHPDHRDAGLAKAILHSVLREAARTHHRAVEAYGQRGAVLPTCVVPTDALEALGFVVVAEHTRFPLLRLDLRRTVTWAESLSQAIEGVVSALGRRERVPAGPTPAR